MTEERSLSEKDREDDSGEQLPPGIPDPDERPHCAHQGEEQNRDLAPVVAVTSTHQSAAVNLRRKLSEQVHPRGSTSPRFRCGGAYAHLWSPGRPLRCWPFRAAW